MRVPVSLSGFLSASFYCLQGFWLAVLDGKCTRAHLDCPKWKGYCWFHNIGYWCWNSWHFFWSMTKLLACFSHSPLSGNSRGSSLMLYGEEFCIFEHFIISYRCNQHHPFLAEVWLMRPNVICYQIIQMLFKLIDHKVNTYYVQNLHWWLIIIFLIKRRTGKLASIRI